MSRDARKPGPLELTTALAMVLARLRAHHQVASPAELDLDRVHEVESAFGVRLPDDLLGIYAARIPVLVERHKLTIGSVIAHTGALRDHRAQGDLVGVGLRGRDSILCLSKNEASKILLFDGYARSCEPFDLQAWIAEQAADVEESSELPPMVASLMAFRPESTLAGKRVRHKIFGDGRALSESGTGPLRKVKCDFPGRGLKMLQARFLEYLE